MKSINLRSEAQKITQLHEYLEVARMNNYMFNLVKANKRTLDWHTHEESDEVFMVIEGTMKLEFRNGLVELSEGEMFVVKIGTEHRPVCEKEVTCLLIEPVGTLTKENTGGSYS